MARLHNSLTQAALAAVLCAVAYPGAASCVDGADNTTTCTIDHYRVITVVYSPDTDGSDDRMFSGERLHLYTRESTGPREFAVAHFMSPHVLDFQPLSFNPARNEYVLRMIRPAYATVLRQLRRTINPALVVTRTGDSRRPDGIGFARIVSEMENVRRPRVATETEDEASDTSTTNGS